jgi:hypothetical protein
MPTCKIQNLAPPKSIHYFGFILHSEFLSLNPPSTERVLPESKMILRLNTPKKGG